MSPDRKAFLPARVVPIVSAALLLLGILVAIPRGTRSGLGWAISHRILAPVYIDGGFWSGWSFTALIAGVVGLVTLTGWVSRQLLSNVKRNVIAALVLFAAGASGVIAGTSLLFAAPIPTGGSVFFTGPLTVEGFGSRFWGEPELFACTLILIGLIAAGLSSGFISSSRQKAAVPLEPRTASR